MMMASNKVLKILPRWKEITQLLISSIICTRLPLIPITRFRVAALSKKFHFHKFNFLIRNFTNKIPFLLTLSRVRVTNDDFVLWVVFARNLSWLCEFPRILYNLTRCESRIEYHWYIAAHWWWAAKQCFTLRL